MSLRFLHGLSKSLSARLSAGVCAALLLSSSPSATAQEIPIKSGEKVAFLGDSITAQGWSNLHGYVRLVVAGLEANGVKIDPIPTGGGGQTSKDMLARIKRDVIDKKPAWVMISCGMNDVQPGRGVELEQFKANVTDMITQCQAAGIKVILFTTTTGRARLEEYSQALRDLGKSKNCLMVDLFPVFTEANKKTDPMHALTGDGVHMTPEGNILMAKTILKVLGCTDAQVEKAYQTWLDLPNAGNFDARVDVEMNKKYFRTSCTLTLRQREKLFAAAQAAKRPTLMHWSKDLLSSLMKKKVKPTGPYDSLDVIFTSGDKDKVQAQLQQEFTDEIAKAVAQTPQAQQPQTPPAK
jgi:lysophospholipase L1-like esterase